MIVVVYHLSEKDCRFCKKIPTGVVQNYQLLSNNKNSEDDNQTACFFSCRTRTFKSLIYERRWIKYHFR